MAKRLNDYQFYFLGVLKYVIMQRFHDWTVETLSH